MEKVGGLDWTKLKLEDQIAQTLRLRGLKLYITFDVSERYMQSKLEKVFKLLIFLETVEGVGTTWHCLRYHL